MNSSLSTIYWLVLITTLLLLAVLPIASVRKVCYDSYGMVICRDDMSSRARIGIWVVSFLLMILIIIGVIWWQQHLANRERDAVAAVEANQAEGPPPTPFESGFVQVQGPSVTYPRVAYHGYGPRTAAAAVPQSAYSVGFTPSKTPYVPQRPFGASYSSRYFPSKPEDTPYVPPYVPPPPATAVAHRFREASLPEGPKSPPKVDPIIDKKMLERRATEYTPRDKNTRFIIPDLPQDTQKKDRRAWQVRFESLRTAPIKDGFEGISVPTSQIQSRSAGVTYGATSEVEPSSTVVSHSKEIV